MITNREEKINNDEYQASASHAKKGSNKRKVCDQYPRRNQKFQRNLRHKIDFSSFECFICHKVGHIARNCPLKAKQFKKGNKKFHAHAVEDDDLEKEKINEDEDSTEEYILISSLTGSVSHGSGT